MNRPLIKKIAIELTDEDWDKGAAHVADRIGEIRAKWAGAEARTNETLVLNDDDLVFSAKPLEASNPERLARHLRRVENRLDEIVELGGGNGVTQNTSIYLIIKRLVTKYEDDPETIAFDLVDVNRSIRRQIKSGEFADDEPLTLLQAANTACISTIRDMEPEIARELDREFGGTVTPLTPEDALLLKEAWQVSVAFLDAPAAATTVEDAAEILSGEIVDGLSDPMPEWSPQVREYRSIVVRRQISRLAQQLTEIVETSKLIKKLDALEKTRTIKAGKAVLTVGGLVSTAILVLSGLIGLF